MNRKHDKKRCIVPGCLSTRHEKHHVFPKDEKYGLLWMKAVSSPILNNLSYKDIYYNKYHVCHLHFTLEDFKSGPRNLFHQKAVPSLLLPKESECDNCRIPALDDIAKEGNIFL